MESGCVGCMQFQANLACLYTGKTTSGRFDTSQWKWGQRQLWRGGGERKFATVATEFAGVQKFKVGMGISSLDGGLHKEFIALDEGYICSVISCITCLKIHNPVCLMADSAYSGCCFGDSLVVTSSTIYLAKSHVLSGLSKIYKKCK